MKAHIITAATAAVAGLTAGLIAAGAGEVWAKEQVVCETVMVVTGPAAKASVEAWAIANLQDAVDAIFGEGTATMAHLKENGLSLQWVDNGTEELEVRSHICMDGNWTEGDPP